MLQCVFRPAKDFPPLPLIRRALRECLVNHLIGSPLVIILIIWPLSQWLGGVATDASFPSLAVIARDIFVYILVEDTLFYWSHRTMHHPALYKHIHKVATLDTCMIRYTLT